MTKTRTEVEDLKRAWWDDPSWDIETTEGFEEFREELAAFQAQRQQEWNEHYRNTVAKKAEEIGCPGNTKLAQYVMRLESQIEKIAELLDDHRR